MGMHADTYYYAGGFDDWFLDCDSDMTAADLAEYFFSSLCANAGDMSENVDGLTEPGAVTLRATDGVYPESGQLTTIPASCALSGSGRVSVTSEYTAGVNAISLVETSTSQDLVDWSARQSIGTSGELQSPNQKYIRFRITLTTTDTSKTPKVTDIQLHDIPKAPYERLGFARPVILNKDNAWEAVLENAFDIIVTSEVNGADTLEFKLPFQDAKRLSLDNEKQVQIVNDVYRIRTVTDDKTSDGRVVTTVYDDTIVTWGCGTKKKKGGRCANKDIPERVLREACATALGLDEFDEDIFLERVDSIQVLEGQVLEFHFYDGTTALQEWVSTAKKDCWTDEHKDRQREWIKNYMANNSDGRYSEFTTRIRCEHCGSTFRRNTQTSKSASSGKMHYWRCPTSGDCIATGIREDRLKDITASVMGLAKHDAESFKEQVEYISVSGDMKLTFHFFDGTDQVIQYNTKRQGTPWTEERHKKFSESMRGKYTEERRKAMSQRMKQIRSEKHWSSKRK